MTRRLPTTIPLDAMTWAYERCAEYLGEGQYQDQDKANRAAEMMTILSAYLAIGPHVDQRWVVTSSEIGYSVTPA